MSMNEIRLPRERDSLLAALELFRDLPIPRNLTSLILFLYVCENEGLNVSELAQVGGVDVTGAARIAKTLAGQSHEAPLPPEAVLFELHPSEEDRRVKIIRLSARGRAMRDQLERMIRRAVPISPVETSAAAA
jgi:DNA-binding MarR family transcriptional regulator